MHFRNEAKAEKCATIGGVEKSGASVSAAKKRGKKMETTKLPCGTKNEVVDKHSEELNGCETKTKEAKKMNIEEMKRSEEARRYLHYLEENNGDRGEIERVKEKWFKLYQKELKETIKKKVIKTRKIIKHYNLKEIDDVEKYRKYVLCNLLSGDPEWACPISFEELSVPLDGELAIIGQLKGVGVSNVGEIYCLGKVLFNNTLTKKHNRFVLFEISDSSLKDLGKYINDVNKKTIYFCIIANPKSKVFAHTVFFNHCRFDFDKYNEKLKEYKERMVAINKEASMYNGELMALNWWYKGKINNAHARACVRDFEADKKGNKNEESDKIFEEYVNELDKIYCEYAKQKNEIDVKYKDHLGFC